MITHSIPFYQKSRQVMFSVFLLLAIPMFILPVSTLKALVTYCLFDKVVHQA